MTTRTIAAIVNGTISVTSTLLPSSAIEIVVDSVDKTFEFILDDDVVDRFELSIIVVVKKISFFNQKQTKSISLRYSGRFAIDARMSVNAINTSYDLKFVTNKNFRYFTKQ